MAEYDRFNALIRIIHRKRGDDFENQVIENIHNAFVSCMPDLPENMKHDIAYYFENACGEADIGNNVALLVGKLREVLYLIEGEYERAVETFTIAEWEYIKEIMDDFALELNQSRITYIMRQIVSRGLLDR